MVSDNGFITLGKVKELRASRGIRILLPETIVEIKNVGIGEAHKPCLKRFMRHLGEDESSDYNVTVCFFLMFFFSCFHKTFILYIVMHVCILKCAYTYVCIHPLYLSLVLY